MLVNLDLSHHAYCSSTGFLVNPWYMCGVQEKVVACRGVLVMLVVSYVSMFVWISTEGSKQHLHHQSSRTYLHLTPPTHTQPEQDLISMTTFDFLWFTMIKISILGPKCSHSLDLSFVSVLVEDKPLVPISTTITTQSKTRMALDRVMPAPRPNSPLMKPHLNSLDLNLYLHAQYQFPYIHDWEFNKKVIKPSHNVKEIPGSAPWSGSKQKFFLGRCHPSTKPHGNRLISFNVILQLTNKQTNKQMQINA